MKIRISLEALKEAVEKMNPGELVNFSITDSLKQRDPIDIGLNEGLEVELSEVETTEGLLSYKGRQVLLYIRDHGDDFTKAKLNGANGRRYHLTDCNVLQGMRKQGRFERYVVTNDTSEEFLISGKDKSTYQYSEALTDLKVCKVCLKHLNYQGYDFGGVKNEIFNNFTMDEFFSVYSSHFPVLPSRRAKYISDDYGKDWEARSKNYRESKNYQCEECRVSLNHSAYRHLLHTHHINGVKSDHKESNLKALCVDCHRKQNFHEHMNVSREQVQLLIKLRSQQGIINEKNDWNDLLRFSDSAVHGVLQLCQQKQAPVPIAGYELRGQASNVIAVAELAWPEYKLAVVLRNDDKAPFTSKGWTVYRTDEFINLARLNINPFIRN